MSRARRLSFVAALWLTACGTTLVLDGALSPEPIPAGASGLRAGFGRADITPPAGLGLAGNGPGSLRARGYRLRLYARALLLEDPGGNRLALVTADLPLGSALLHRRVAALTAAADGIGLDRLIIAVTHTHAGPSHYFEGAIFNEQSSSVVGYDAVLLDSLAHRIAAAVHAARLDLRDAKAAWGSRPVWGYTRIRSLPAMLRNSPPPAPPSDAPDSLGPEYRLVDPTLSMLRIDQRDPTTGGYRPGGAFSVFAMHGTGNAAVNELFDADIHGLVERRLERHIDSALNRQEGRFVPRAFHLLANGAEGDVSPAWPSESRCAVPVVAPWPLLGGPFTQSLWQWQPIRETAAAACLSAARRAVDRIGNGLGEEAIKLFESLAGKLEDRLELARAFATVPLREKAESLGICRVPAAGMSAIAGTADAPGWLRHWRALGLLAFGLDQSAGNPNGTGCHGAKRQLLDAFFGGIPNRLAVSPKIPSFAQVSVYQVGNRLIGTVPAEVTTTAGRRLQKGMLTAAHRLGVLVDTALVVGLTNGHLGYVTTAEEYAAQWYEGGMTMYGPGEAAMFGRALAGLTSALSSGMVWPPASAKALAIFAGTRQTILSKQPAPAPAPGTIERVWCSRDTLYANFRLGAPQDWAVRDARVAPGPRIEVRSAGAVVAWDDDPAVELHLRALRGNPARWQLRWQGAKPSASYVVRLENGVESPPVACSMSP